MSCELGLNVNVLVSDQLNRQLVNLTQDVIVRCVNALSSQYNFDAEEAKRFLGVEMIKVERKVVGKVLKEKAVKVSVPKAAFPLPYNGEFDDKYCFALRQNNGLYTQCVGIRKGENHFCKSCATKMQKTGAEVPEYGTIQMRQAVGIFEYIDPKGRKPIAYTKVMKKYKLTQEQVIEEAGKFNMTINPEHFVVPEETTKRGRPASAEKEPKVKGSKGRPKKSKKVLEIEGDDEDLFATLIANANLDAESEPELEDSSNKAAKKAKTDEEKEAERLAKEAEKEAKRLATEQAKAEKQAKLAAEKAEKEAKLAAEKAEKQAKLAAEKAEKEAKKEAERLEREAKKKAAEEEKAAKKAAAEAKKAKKESKSTTVENDDEPDVVKKIEFEGKKYLKSKKTGIIYDYIEYTTNGDQVVVGKWNDNTNKIDFSPKDEEEEEDEYDE
jgi:hypothetical protein